MQDGCPVLSLAGIIMDLNTVCTSIAGCMISMADTAVGRISGLGTQPASIQILLLKTRPDYFEG